MTDALPSAMRRADHWTQLGWGETWAAVARLLEPDRAVAARAAWRHAADGYEAYYEAHARGMPASRWDHDYGPEASDARTRATAHEPIAGTPAALPPWIEAALDGRLDEAVAIAPAPAPADDLGRAVGRALAIACVAAGRQADADRLSPA